MASLVGHEHPLSIELSDPALFRQSAFPAQWDPKLGIHVT